MQEICHGRVNLDTAVTTGRKVKHIHIYSLGELCRCPTNIWVSPTPNRAKFVYDLHMYESDPLNISKM